MEHTRSYTTIPVWPEVRDSQHLSRAVDKKETKFKEEKKKHKKCSYNGSPQHSACSFMPACFCRTLVDTNVLLYEPCCSVQGRLKAVLLCLRYVDTVPFGAWFVPTWCARKKKSKFEKKTSWLFVFLLHMAIRADDIASSLQEDHLPCSHVHLAVGAPQCHDLR